MANEKKQYADLGTLEALVTKVQELFATKTELDGFATKAELDGKASLDHTHDGYYTQEQIDNLLDGKADSDHNHEGVYAEADHTHDDAYHTRNEITSLLDKKADSDHNHEGTYADINHDHEGVYSEVNHNHDSDYADINHNHEGTYADINHDHEGVYCTPDDVSDMLEGYATSNHDHGDKYAEADHTHDGYYEKSEIDTALSGKADSNHNHGISHITNLQDILDNKVNAEDVYTKDDHNWTVIADTTITADVNSISGINVSGYDNLTVAVLCVNSSNVAKTGSVIFTANNGTTYQFPVWTNLFSTSAQNTAGLAQFKIIDDWIICPYASRHIKAPEYLTSTEGGTAVNLTGVGSGVMKCTSPISTLAVSSLDQDSSCYLRAGSRVIVWGWKA